MENKGWTATPSPDAVRYGQREVERTARALVGATLQQYYEEKKRELFVYIGEITRSFLKMGKILAEMREKAPSLLRNFANENGVMSLETLQTLADCYEIFGESVPRDDIVHAYYIHVAETVRNLRDVWAAKSSIDEATYEEAIELLKQLDPKQVGPRGLAAKLMNRFGVVNTGEKPFSGIRLVVLSDYEIGQKAAELHPLVAPDFKEWAEAERERKRAERQQEIKRVFPVEASTGATTSSPRSAPVLPPSRPSPAPPPPMPTRSPSPTDVPDIMPSEQPELVGIRIQTLAGTSNETGVVLTKPEPLPVSRQVPALAPRTTPPTSTPSRPDQGVRVGGASGRLPEPQAGSVTMSLELWFPDAPMDLTWVPKFVVDMLAKRGVKVEVVASRRRIND